MSTPTKVLIRRIRIWLFHYSPIWISYGSIDDFGIGPNYASIALRTMGWSFRLFARTPWYSKFAIWLRGACGGQLRPFTWDIYFAYNKKGASFYRKIQLIGNP